MNWLVILSAFIAPGGIFVTGMVLWREVRTTRTENDLQHRQASAKRVEEATRIVMKLEELHNDVAEIKRDVKETKRDMIDHVNWFHNTLGGMRRDERPDRRADSDQ